MTLVRRTVRRTKNIFVVGKLWSGHIAGARWNLRELRRLAVVNRWFRWGEGVGECGCVREYAEISIQLAGQTIVSYRRFGIENNMNSLGILHQANRREHSECEDSTK